MIPAQDWLKACLSGHHDCQLNHATRLLTRLLSLSRGPPPLVLTTGWTHRPRYATLSHCWGNIRFLQLTKETLNPFLAESLLGELPKTFADAIRVVRRLDIHYLWIDLLCIIQGDEKDWKNESTLMHSVYSRSTLNIAASSTKNSSQGCFLKPETFMAGLQAESFVENSTK